MNKELPTYQMTEGVFLSEDGNWIRKDQHDNLVAELIRERDYWKGQYEKVNFVLGYIDE